MSKRARIQEKGIGGMLDGENYFGGDGGGDDKPGESLGRYFQQNERAPSTTLILKPFQLQKNQWHQNGNMQVFGVFLMMVKVWTHELLNTSYVRYIVFKPNFFM